jgi:hypothetical protein
VPETSKPKLVLLHGAYHGAWIWDGLRAELAKAAVSCEAPDLSYGRMGEDEEELLSISSRTVILAHSLAGTLVPPLFARPGDALPLKAIFLAAYLPCLGQSASDLARLDKGALVGRALKLDKEAGAVSLDPTEAAVALYGSAASEPEAVRALQRLQPQPLASFERRCDWPAPAGQPYIVCTRDQAITPALQRRMAADARCSPMVSLDSCHMPMISAPHALAKCVLGLAPELLE